MWPEDVEREQDEHHAALGKQHMQVSATEAEKSIRSWTSLSAASV